MKSNKLILAALMAGAAQTAFAVNNQPYGAIEGTYFNPDNLRQEKNGSGGALIFGIPAGQYLAGELNLFGVRADQTNGTSFNKTWGGGLDLHVYPFKRTGTFAPFLSIGSGSQYEDRNGPERGYLFLNAGGGFLANLTADGRTALRVEAKRVRVHDYELVPGQDNLWDTRISAGIQVAFGNDPVPPPPVLLPPPPPPPALPPPPPPPPAPPLDSDQDGVPDSIDACPGTPLGMQVDARGCAIKAAKVVLHDINFEFGKAKLTEDSKTSLDKVVAGLKGQPSMHLLIEGHTDSVGSVKANLALSKKRAAAAKAYLVESGISEKRLVSKGFGKSRPIATNKTAEGRAENRRVEFKVIEQ